MSGHAPSRMKKGLALGAVAVLLLAGAVLLPRVRTAWGISRARVAMAANDCGSVLQALDGVDAGGVDGQFVHEVRAFCLLKAKDWAKAHAEASASLAIAPDSVQALTYRLTAARELGETGEAEEDLGRLIAADPKNVTWREARAELRAGREAWAAAIEDADVALAADPKRPEMLDVRVHAWHALGNWENAYRDAVALVEVKPSAVGHRDAADLAIPLGKLDEADAHIAAALAEQPDDIELNVLACRVRVAHTEAPGAGAAELDAAVRECERTVKLAPQHGVTRRRYARMLIEKGDFAAARPQLDEALRLTPGSCLAHRLRAELMLAEKKPAEALQSADAALAAVGRDAEVNAVAAEGSLRQMRADALIALKRTAEARVELEKALALLAPDDEDVATLKKKLEGLPGAKRP